MMVAIRERDECQFVKCCFSCPVRVAAKHTQEGNVKSDICMCAASTMFARRRENHMKQDSKGEIQQDSLLYYHGNPALMKSRKTIKYLWKKNLCYEYPLGWGKMCSWKELDIFTIWWCLLTKPLVLLLGKADWKSIPFAKLFNSSCC